MTQPDVIVLIQVPMLEPNEASQNILNVGKLKGVHAPELEALDVLVSAGLFIKKMSDLNC